MLKQAKRKRKKPCRTKKLFKTMSRDRSVLTKAISGFILSEVLTDEAFKGTINPKVRFSIRHLRYAALRLKGIAKTTAYEKAGFGKTRNREKMRNVENHPVVQLLFTTHFGKGMDSLGLDPKKLSERAQTLLNDETATFKEKKDYLFELIEIAGWGTRAVELNIQLAKAMKESSIPGSATGGFLETLEKTQHRELEAGDKWGEEATLNEHPKVLDPEKEKEKLRESVANTKAGDGGPVPEAPPASSTTPATDKMGEVPGQQQREAGVTGSDKLDK